MEQAIIVAVWLAAAAVFGGFGAWIASQRDRAGAEGFILGAVFGPLGILVELFLPQGVAGPKPPPAPRQPVARPAKPSRVGKPLRPIDDDQLL